MKLKRLELVGFKSFAKRTTLEFLTPVTAIVGPNGSGKSNVVEAVRFVLGEQSMKSLRGKGGVDLIFKGSKSLSSLSRASATIVFDNKDKKFSFADGSKIVPLDFDEVSITREVGKDGVNNYSINGTEVRLKDIIEMLASVHIGSSGHHIISQGEADRLLSANPRDRRVMIEDALGLKIYQYRIRESERKLEKTAANMKEVQSLRREIAPHIQFLKKQVEKVEKAEGMRQELSSLYKDYLANEAAYLDRGRKALKEKEHALNVREKSILHDLSSHETTRGSSASGALNEAVKNLETELAKLNAESNDIERNIGRLEGILEGLRHTKKNAAPSARGNAGVSKERVVEVLSSLIEELEAAEEHIIRDDVVAAIGRIRDYAQSFLSRIENETEGADNASAMPDLSAEESQFEKEKETLLAEREKLNAHIAGKERELSEEKRIESGAEAKIRESERAYYELLNEKNKIGSERAILSMEAEKISAGETAFAEEVREGTVLIGSALGSFKDSAASAAISREEQEEKRKKIERIKIKLEDVGGGGGGDIMKEYEDATARDQFLLKEVADLDTSIKSLEGLIGDLKTKIDTEFKIGIEKINKEFQHFFSTMFGGGSAYLSIVVEHKRKAADDDEELTASDDEELRFERGIEIHISLPHKKMKDLHMLSGGERSLVSIALLFAMSQVNPPPFLVLDETDAALDEANSRRYGDMLETLSKLTQLIVDTHNRETMSRAGVLYGVTIGADGGSKLLSIRFEEAVQIAK